MSCSTGGGDNYNEADINALNCQTELRNKAARLGARLVVLTTQQVGLGDCFNCVAMVATAYRPATQP